MRREDLDGEVKLIISERARVVGGVCDLGIVACGNGNTRVFNYLLSLLNCVGVRQVVPLCSTTSATRAAEMFRGIRHNVDGVRYDSLVFLFCFFSPTLRAVRCVSCAA